MKDRVTKPRGRRPRSSRLQDMPALQSTKRTLDSVSCAEVERPEKGRRTRAPLTRKNLAIFDKMAKERETSPIAAPHESTDDSSPTKTTSTAPSGLAGRAWLNGILHPPYSQPPANLEDLRDIFARSRRSASPTESAHGRYVHKFEAALNQATMASVVTRMLLKDHEEGPYEVAFNQAFTAFPEDVGFNSGLPAPQPDFIEGPSKFDYVADRRFCMGEEISGAVLYQDTEYSITLPHIAGELKGPGEEKKVKQRNNYVGAALVYARNQALSYLGTPDPPGYAAVTTFTTDGENLELYAHYAATSTSDGILEYHQYRIDAGLLPGSYQMHKDFRRRLRNMQDHAKQQSFALRDQLREHCKKRKASSQ